MILNLKLIGEKEIPVKAHRVLSKVFPELELYVHYAIKQDHYNEFTIDKNSYHISTSNGFRIPDVFSTNGLAVLMTRTIHFIQNYGVEKILKEKQALANFELKKAFPQDFISSLDTAITPETNIENLHAKIKYLNKQLDFSKYEVKQLKEKFGDVKEKWIEIRNEWRTSNDIPRFYITGMNKLFGIKED